MSHGIFQRLNFTINTELKNTKTLPLSVIDDTCTRKFSKINTSIAMSIISFFSFTRHQFLLTSTFVLQVATNKSIV